MLSSFEWRMSVFCTRVYVSYIRPSVGVDDTHFSGMYLYDTYIVGHREISPEAVQYWITKTESVMRVLQQFKRVSPLSLSKEFFEIKPFLWPKNKQTKTHKNKSWKSGAKEYFFLFDLQLGLNHFSGREEELNW